MLPRSKGTRVNPKLTAECGSVLMVPALTAWKMQDWESNGFFLCDFRKLIRPGNMRQHWSFSEETLRGHWTKLLRWCLGCVRDSQDLEMPWDSSQEELHIESETSQRDLQAAELQVCSHLRALTWSSSRYQTESYRIWCFLWCSQPCFCLLFPHCAFVPPFRNGKVYPVALYVGIM